MNRQSRHHRLKLPGLLLAWTAAAVLCPGPAAPRVLEFVQQQMDASLLGARALAVSEDGKHVYIGGIRTLVFERDDSTGELAFADAADGADIIAISLDGRNLYMHGIGPLRVLARDRSSGTTALVEAWEEGMSGIHRLSPASVTLSPDGRHLYVATIHSSLVVFARDPGTGVLSYVETTYDGVDGVVGLEGVRHLTVSPDGAHVYVASSPSFGGRPHAVAVLARNAATGALSLVETIFDDAAGVEALHGAHLVLVSPDGRHVYVASSDNVVAFARDPSSGRLTVVGINSVDARFTMAISPDGRHLYAVSGLEAAVTVFGRDSSAGTLSLVETWTDGIAGLGGADAVAVTPDGRHLYVASDSNSGWAAVFARNPGSGMLGFVASYLGDVAGDADGIFGAETVATSPDGRHLYVASRHGSVSTLSRSAETGELDFIEEVDESSGADGLDSAESVAVSPDGRNVYVASSQPDHALAAFTRDAVTGELGFLEAHFDGVGGVDGLHYARAVSLSPDGRHAYVASSGDHAVAAFVRDPASGALSFLDAYFDNVGGVDGLLSTQSLAVSPDGEHVYVISYEGLAVFERDVATGRLLFQEAHVDDASRRGVAVSPDGKNVYVMSSVLTAFSRDETTGKLSRLEAHEGLISAYDLAVSPDGEYVYAFGEELTVFSREAATGALDLLEAQTFPRYDRYWGPAGTQSPDGDHLYVAASVDFDDAIVVVRRNDGPCRPGPQTLCLGDNRFRVELDWRDFAGNTGSTRGVPYGADESGLLWFFSANNWEMLIKVLDGCGFNERFWVFAAASTDVEYTLRVTDMLTGVSKTYSNPLGNAAPAITDTEAFATCDESVPESSPEPLDASFELASALAGLSARAGTDSMATDDGPAPSSSLGILKESTPRHLLIGLGDKCLDVEGGGAADGTPVNIYDCNRGSNQRWQFKDECGYGGCTEDFEIVGTGGKCLQPGEDSGAGRTPLVIGPCGGPEDRWEYRGFYPERLTLVHSDGQCADVQGGSTDNRTPVNLFECHDGANQLWEYHQIRCVPSPIHRCLNRERFVVEVDWRDFAGNTGRGRVIPFGSSDSGLFWFFTPGNWEMLVKVLDGCGINDRYWVFGAATTDVEYTLRVTDTETGRVQEYFNPLGRAAPAITDTEAFATCP